MSNREEMLKSIEQEIRNLRREELDRLNDFLQALRAGDKKKYERLQIEILPEPEQKPEADKSMFSCPRSPH